MSCIISLASRSVLGQKKKRKKDEIMLGVRSLSLWYAFLWLQGNRIIKILHGPQSA